MDDPWVLHLVVRAERDPDRRPDHSAALEAVAAAVLSFLHDPRATEPDGSWHEAVTAWRSTNIRKIARRARGAAWDRVAAVAGAGDGLVLQHGIAEVAVLQPTLRSATPGAIEPLQVGGLALDVVDRPVDRRAPVTVLLAPLGMSTGKAAAQVGHAVQLASEELQRSDPALLDRWARGGWRTVVREARSSAALSNAADVLAVVRDAGFTEVPAGSTTAVAVTTRRDEEPAG